ncbi:hypothetical protein [Nocardia sp. alder85J]|uniref:hypothetical protein n=1 Tax=Nocardia sp. alder85J TaxID=2862949 RepID=UPI00225B4B69|nr:hypothetical protein [Nocardia sp. alder85J]MCX4093202.1 hypothetical protein [Nocardia sp. alder85J]
MAGGYPGRNSGGESRTRLRDFGPVWITAITGLIGALAAAGFIVHDKTSAHPAPGTPAPATSHLGGDGPAPAVYTSGSVDVRVATGNGVVVHQPSQWFPLGGAGDLNPTPVALSPGDGAALSFFGAQQPSYQDCRTRQDYAGALPWTKIPSGSYICIKIADNRVGQTRVDYRSDQSGAVADVDVSGLI